MQLKRIITSALSVSLLLSTFNIGFAAEPNEVTDPLPNKGQSSITLEIKDTSGGGGTDPDNPDIPPVDPTDIIIATVPVELPIIMDLEGNVTVPTDAKIINHVEDKGIKVTKISTMLESDWTAANYTDDFTAKADNTKELGLSFRNDKMDTAGEFTLTEDNWNIAANGSLLLNMQAKLPKQTVQGKGKIATVSFTLDWSGRTDGSDNVTPDNPDTETHTVTFTTDGKGIIEGDTTVTVKNGETVSFPTAKPASIRYELSDWVETSSNSSVEPTTPIVSDVTIKAVFNEKAESPKNWFTTDGANTITGLSDEYLNMIDAPTDLIIPKTIGGSTIKSIGANAFENKDLITSIVIPESVTAFGTRAFAGCTGLEEISLPTNLDIIYNDAFYNCSSLTIDLPDNIRRIGFALVNKPNPIYGDRCSTTTFYNVKKLILGSEAEKNYQYNVAYAESPYIGVNEIIIREGVTTIGNNAFTANKVTIPNSVQSIGSQRSQWYKEIIIDNTEGNIKGAPSSSDKVIYLR